MDSRQHERWRLSTRVRCVACAAFRATVLAEELITGKWTGNDTDRGYKVMRLNRSDCDDKPTVELRLALVDGKAQCIVAGAVQDTPLDTGAGDYGKVPRRTQ